MSLYTGGPSGQWRGDFANPRYVQPGVRQAFSRTLEFRSSPYVTSPAATRRQAPTSSVVNSDARAPSIFGSDHAVGPARWSALDRQAAAPRSWVSCVRCGANILQSARRRRRR
jgi:hypothetical protein